MTARLVVLVSGNGTNLQALIDACASGDLDAEVVAVVSDRADAFGLERARRAEIPAHHVPADGRSRAIYDGVLAHIVTEQQPTIVVLAGWMRLLGNAFLRRFAVINIHPALPGAFPGLHAIDRAFAAWSAGAADESGVMVHWVPDEGVDDGPLIRSSPVPFEDNDTLESFGARIHETEHRLIVEAAGLAIEQLQTAAQPTSTGAP